jgi:hypothetical protein
MSSKASKFLLPKTSELKTSLVVPMASLIWSRAGCAEVDISGSVSRDGKGVCVTNRLGSLTKKPQQQCAQKAQDQASNDWDINGRALATPDDIARHSPNR